MIYMKNPQFTTGELYHIYNRGVEKREIFLNDKDRLRFIHDLWEFNDISPAPKFINKKTGELPQYSEIESPNIEPTKNRKRDLLVEILAFCLMPNHFHLLLKQLVDGGIVKFMQKIGAGYAGYFNEKYERSGHLFQGRFKAIHLNNELYFLRLPYYIHANPIELIEPQWKERKIRNFAKTLRFIESYRWSSHLDYIGKRNFPSVISQEFLQKILGNDYSYRKGFKEFLEDLSIEKIQDIIIER